MVIHDRYAEARCVCKKYPLGLLIKTAIIVATVLLAFVGLTMGAALQGTVFMICGMGIFFLYFALWKYTSVEYEYLFIAGEFSVDKIYGAISRKQVLNISFDQVELIATCDSDRIKQYGNHSALKVMDFTSGDVLKRRYAMVFNDKGATIKILLEPTTEMLELFYLSSPSKVFLEQRDMDLIKNATRI